MRGLSIGNLKLKNKLFLAPMVDVSDMAFRLICRKQGVAMAYTEMLQVEALLLAEDKLKTKTLTCKEDSPLGIQITGRRISDFKKVVPKLRSYDLVDINCGCPGHLTIDHGSGSYLMNSADKVASMVQVLKDAGLIVTVKGRLGFKKNNVLDFAKKVEKAGADALTIHARLASQGRGDKADYEWFPKVKEKIGIPLIGNGDINSAEKVEEVLGMCDGAMIARAAIGNPFIFKESLDYLRTGKYKETPYKKKLKVYLEYLNIAKKNNLLKMYNVKYIGGNVLKGFEGASQMRDKFVRLKSFEEIERFVRKLV